MADDIKEEAQSLRARREQQLFRDRFVPPIFNIRAGQGDERFGAVAWTGGSRPHHCYLYQRDFWDCQALAYMKHKPVNRQCAAEKKDLEECVDQQLAVSARITLVCSLKISKEFETCPLCTNYPEDRLRKASGHIILILRVWKSPNRPSLLLTMCLTLTIASNSCIGTHTTGYFCRKRIS